LRIKNNHASWGSAEGQVLGYARLKHSGAALPDHVKAGVTHPEAGGVRPAELDGNAAINWMTQRLDRATAKSYFNVPYVQWGLDNPSFLISKADNDVAIDLNLVGQVSN